MTSLNEQNRTWRKKSQIVASGGYFRVLKPEHPKANNLGYISQHLDVWEAVHGKPLPDGWHIHHINGIRDDNRPVNLVGLSSKKHGLILRVLQERIQKLEALLNGQAQLL